LDGYGRDSWKGLSLFRLRRGQIAYDKNIGIVGDGEVCRTLMRPLRSVSDLVRSASVLPKVLGHHAASPEDGLGG